MLLGLVLHQLAQLQPQEPEMSAISPGTFSRPFRRAAQAAVAWTVAFSGLGVSATAHAATYYVAPTGSDSTAGTEGAPWKSMAKA